MGQLAVNLITVYRGKIAPNKEYCNSSYTAIIQIARILCKNAGSKLLDKFELSYK